MEKIKIGKKNYFLLAVLSAFLLGAPASGFGETSKANANDSLKSEAKKIELKAEEDFDKALKVTQIMDKLCYIEICTESMDMPQLTKDLISNFRQNIKLTEKQRQL